jgi:lysophospholipase L1-like esterase
MSTARTARDVNGRPRVGLAARFAAAGCALLVAFGLCEAAARMIYPAPPDPAREPQIFYQSDPAVGFIHVPNQQGWLDDGFATINALGLRGPQPEIPKPLNSLRILAIGDSTTFGWGVNDDGNYPAQLEALLRRQFPSTPLSVVNGGVGAYDLKHDARLLRHFAPTLAPDIVLVGLYWNDLPYDQMLPDGVPPPNLGQDPEPVIAPAAGRSKPFRIGNQPGRLNRILRSSRVMYVLRQSWLRLMAPTAEATNLVQWEMALLQGRRSAAIDAGWADIERTLEDIRSMGQAGGFAVGVVIIPIRAQVEEHYPNAAYQSRVRPMAEKLGMFVVDPLPLLLAERDHAGLFIPYDRMHLSARGNAQIARAAFDALKDRPELHGGFANARAEGGSGR